MASPKNAERLNASIAEAENIKRKLEESRKNINRVQDISIMEFDELCTYIKKDRETVGSLPSYGLLLIENQIKLLILR